MSASPSNASRRCPRCGAELPADVAPDLCPKCLLQAALPTQAGGPKTEKVAGPAPVRTRGLPQPGEQLGHYRIVRLLGEGGMGAVFDAEDLESGRRVALKVLGQKLDSPEARERFFREGRVAASINHPNSVYVFGTEEIGGTPAIAMELVAGGTLQDRVRERGPLPVAEAVDAVLQIIAGLEAARRIGILHRDIKPSNCFRDADGTVKIGDFGLSISTAIRTEPALTSAGAFLGTPAFCSPEQLRGDELNVRSDMYSVGATLFYLLTGRTPFEAKNTVQLLATVLEQRAPSPKKFRPAMPQGLAKAILRCLEKQPGERFRNYQELGKALAPYNSTAPTPATLGLRFLAGAIDHLVLSAVCTALLLLAGGSPMMFLNLASKKSPMLLTIVLPTLAGALLYYGLLEGLRGAAVGKAICRLRIVGPDRNVPGVGRALVRAMMYVLGPMLPYWIAFGANPRAYFEIPQLTQALMGFSYYIILALLFSTVRRRNGFAALQDLITGTRVISQVAIESRTMLAAAELPPPVAEGGPMVGPYHVLETLGQSEGIKWLLGYDLRLLRKVWVRVVPPGTPPVPAALRNLGRVGRLRWLAGRRAAEENWDAFEATGGRPLVHLARTRQPWSQVRFWLYDLAREIGAATRDGTLPPVLGSDRVWITGDGQAKLLDFPAPGLAAGVPAGDPARQPVNAASFLSEVATAALAGRAEIAAGTGGAVEVPLPMHARQLLDRLPQLPGPDVVAEALKPLLSRLAVVTRWRRAGIVAGCLAFPVVACMAALFGMTMMEQWSRTNPGLAELQDLLQTQTAMNSRWMKDKPHPTDRQFAVYIAGHYRGVITNDAAWTSGFALTLIKGESRRFAEQSLELSPAPTETELKEADAAVGKYRHKTSPFASVKQPWFPFAMLYAALAIYVCIPALVAALLFRGGLVLLAARVTFVRKDGRRASRLRVFWRALVAWSPVLLGLFLVGMLKVLLSLFVASAAAGLFVCALTILSLALPDRGLPERLSGTWLVPR
jgi:eukaryotic-like serine/threonine-protein kinase